MLAQTGFPHMATGVALVISCGLAAPAIADTPAALHYVPSDAPIYVVVPDLGRLIGDLSATNQALAGSLPPEAAQLGMGLFMAQMLTTQPGVETNGSAAVIIDPEGGDPDEAGPPQPSFLAILPIDNLETFAGGPFMTGQHAQLVDGMLQTASPDGETFYMRDIGTHAIAGVDREKVESYKPGDWMEANEKALGASGLSQMGGGDIMLVANIAALKGPIDEMLEQADQQVNFLAMMGGGDQVKQFFAMYKQAATVLQRDGSVGMVSFNVGADGISVDLGASFREGTPSYETFNAAGDTGPLLGAIPASDFLVAYAMDVSDEHLRGLMDAISAMAPAQGGGDPMGLKAMVSHATGFSGMIGSSPAALGGAGLFAKQLSYVRTDDTGAATDTMRTSMKDLNGTSMMGMTYATTYEANAAEVDGVKVDTYSLKMQADPEAAQSGMGAMFDPAMAMSLLYGMEGGPAGYVAHVDGGLYVTASKNGELLSSAFKAARGGAGLTANELVAKVGSRLQDDRFAEGYVSADQIFNAVGPFAQMFGMIDEFKPIEPLSPIGMSARADEGGVVGRMYVPADVIGFIAKFAQEVNGDDAGGGDEQAEPDF
ncbi:MAG: hypothetical protein H6810_01510 [Phycisphaeraceae bacterium]|nr:MAG: hypothetical protein H6810_01510 [Phycisphaeraceae bacterium]